MTGHNVTNINIIFRTGEFIEMNGLQETEMTGGEMEGRDNTEGSLRPPKEYLYVLFIGFRNIHLYFSDKSK